MRGVRLWMALYVLLGCKDHAPKDAASLATTPVTILCMFEPDGSVRRGYDLQELSCEDYRARIVEAARIQGSETPWLCWYADPCHGRPQI